MENEFLCDGMSYENDLGWIWEKIEEGPWAGQGFEMERNWEESAQFLKISSN